MKAAQRRASGVLPTVEVDRLFCGGRPNANGEGPPCGVLDGLGLIADAQQLGHPLTGMAKMPCCWCATAGPLAARCTEHAFMQVFSISPPYKGLMDAFLRHHECLQSFESAIVCTPELVFQIVRRASASC